MLLESTDDLLFPGALALLALFPALYVGAFVHELGHALLGKWGGHHIGSFGMGVARPFLVWRWGETRIYLARSRPLQGITFAVHPNLFASRGALVLFLVGGIALQGAFGLLLLALAWLTPLGRWGLGTAGLVNTLWALSNLIPLRFQAGPFTLQSDGALLFQALRKGALDVSPRDLIHVIQGLRGLWKDVHDILTLRICLLAAALNWLTLDNIEAARQAWYEAESLPVEPSWAHAYSALVKGEIATRLGALDVANDAFERAERLFATENHAVGLLLTAVGRIEWPPPGENQTGAVAGLAELLDHPEAVRRPGLRSALVKTQLTLQVACPRADRASLEAEFRAIRRLHPSAIHDRLFYLALARAAVASGDREQGLRAFRAAIRTVRRLCAGWTDEESREAFVTSQASLVAEARTFLEQEERFEEAEALAELFLSPKKVQRRQIEAGEQRTRRQHRLARFLALSSLAAGVAGVRVATLGPAPSDRLVGVAGMVLATAILVLLTSYGMQVCNRLFGLFRQSFGWYPWLFLIGGWIAAIVLLFLLPT